MNRSTVEKQIERVLGELGISHWRNRVGYIEELRALTELLAHYPKEDSGQAIGLEDIRGAPDRYCCGVHTVCGYDSSTGKCRY